MVSTNIDLDGMYPDLDRVLWHRHGSIDVCNACGFVREGTASAAIAHRERCSAVIVYQSMRFAMATAVLAEREACAKVAEQEGARDPAGWGGGPADVAASIAAAIRARGTPPEPRCICGNWGSTEPGDVHPLCPLHGSKRAHVDPARK
jgi:hypothetical protein